MDISRLADKLRSQNFAPDDSVILSAINHPLTAAQKGADWFAGQVNRAANIPEQYDNPNPLAGYTPEQQVGGALNLAGLLQTSAFPFAPKSTGGVLGTIYGYGNAENIANKLNKKYGDLINADITGDKKGLTLDKIIVNPESRNKGIGGNFMNDLISYADETGQPIRLTAAGDFGGNKSGQMRFYKKYGFIENKGKNKDFEFRENMYRLPDGTYIEGNR